MRSVTPEQQHTRASAARLSGAGPAPAGRADGPARMDAIGRRVLAGARAAVAVHQMRRAQLLQERSPGVRA